MNRFSKGFAPIAIHRRKNPLLSLQEEWDKALNNFYDFTGLTHMPLGKYEDLMLSPAIDIVDDKNSLKIEAEMPGMGEEDVKVSISDGMLIIKGAKETSRKNQDKNYMKREISYGSYERIVPLPDTIDMDKAKASFKKGMLWVEIPKKAETIKSSRDLKIEKV